MIIIGDLRKLVQFEMLIALLCVGVGRSLMNDFSNESCHFLRIVLTPPAQGGEQMGIPGREGQLRWVGLGARGNRDGTTWVQGAAEMGQPGCKGKPRWDDQGARESRDETTWVQGEAEMRRPSVWGSQGARGSRDGATWAQGKAEMGRPGHKGKPR